VQYIHMITSIGAFYRLSGVYVIKCNIWVASIHNKIVVAPTGSPMGSGTTVIPCGIHTDSYHLHMWRKPYEALKNVLEGQNPNPNQ
jgi:hypothetical protein